MFSRKKKPEIWFVGDAHLKMLEEKAENLNLNLPPHEFEKQAEKVWKKIETREKALPYLKGEEKKKVQEELEKLKIQYHKMQLNKEIAKMLKGAEKDVDLSIKELSKINKKVKKSERASGKEVIKVSRNLLRKHQKETKEAKKAEKKARIRKREIESINSFLFSMKPDIYFTEYEKKPFDDTFLFAKKAEKKGIPIKIIDDQKLSEEQEKIFKEMKEVIEKLKMELLIKKNPTKTFQKLKRLDKKFMEYSNERSKAMAEKVATEMKKQGAKKAIVMVGQGHIYRKGQDVKGVQDILKQKMPNAKIHIIDLGEQKAVSKMIYPAVYLKNKAKEFIEEEKLKKIAEKAEKNKAKANKKVLFFDRMKKRGRK